MLFFLMIQKVMLEILKIRCMASLDLLRRGCRLKAV